MSESYNPCPIGWRVPTYLEILDLKLSGSTWVNAGEGGMDNIAGRWFAGNHNSDRSGSIFLPAGGIIGNNGVSTYRFSTSNGQYFTTDVSGDNVYRLRFTSTIVEGSGANRAAGLSIRCVKDL
jgi:uncharacterized protein (TIGR02145 family)